VDAAGRGRGHRYDLVAEIGPANRLALDWPVSPQIVERNQAAAPLHLRHDQTGDRPLVKPLRAKARNSLERFGEVRLPQKLTGLIGLSAGMLEIGLARLIGFKALVPFRKGKGQPMRNGKAFFRKLDSRGKHTLTRHGAIMLERIKQPCHSSRHPGRGTAITRFITVNIAALIQEHVAARRSRRRLAVVDRGDFFRAGERDQHEAAASDIAGLRMGDGKGEADGNSSVHGVSAGL
jgi:hypothetical protein